MVLISTAQLTRSISSQHKLDAGIAYPLAPSLQKHGDFVRFGEGQLGLYSEGTLLERIEKAYAKTKNISSEDRIELVKKLDQQALNFFTLYKNDLRGLIAALRKEGFVICNGNQNPISDEMLNWFGGKGAKAAFCAPSSVAFSDAPDVPEFPKSTPSSIRSLFTELEEKKQFTLFLRKGPLSKLCLLHEAYHAIQMLYGLPAGTSYQDDKESLEFLIDFFNNSPHKQLYLMFIIAPILKIQSKIGQIKTQEQGGGASLRIAFQSEFEVTAFLERNHEILGLDASDRLSNRLASCGYHLISDYSLKLDKAMMAQETG